jgi:Na+/H+-dicarboxylate symporter
MPVHRYLPLRQLTTYLSSLVEGRLWLKVLIGMALGLATGFVLGPTLGWVDPERGSLIGNWLALPGMLFLAAVQMIVVPLVFASIVLGLASSDNVDQLRRLGIAAVSYFIVTTAVAVTIGLSIANVVRPGRLLGPGLPADIPDDLTAPVTAFSFGDLPQMLVGLLPGNPLGSMVQGEMLQIVIVGMITGVALVALRREDSKPLLDLLSAVQQVCMMVVKWAMLLAPLAVFGLMARLISQTGLEALLSMGLYVLTVVGGLVILFLLYLGLLWGFAGEAPGKFMRATRELLLLAFSTSSSAAVMPLSIRTAEESLGVRPSVAQFVIPLGATINMNGTALYQGVAAMFLAQVYGIEISTAGMALITAMAVGASIGSPATPGVGIVILAMVLSTVGIPAEGIALLMGVDRILDMCRTSVNVAGDVVASKLLNRWVSDRD